MNQKGESPLSVLERLVRAVSEAPEQRAVYDHAIDALRDGLGVARASVLLFDDEGVMRFQAWRGISDDYRARVDGHSPWTPDTPDPTPILVPDAAAAPEYAALRPVFEAEGIAALAFIPLIVGARVVGKFMLYYDRPHAFDRDEVLFASTVARHVAFTLDRNRAEQAARSSAARLTFALGAAAMGTWEWQVGTNRLEWSDSLRQMHGLAPGDTDVSFERYQREIHPDDRDRVHAALAASLEGHEHHIEYRIVLGDGSVKWVEGKGRVVRDEAGVPRRMIGICTDISARKRVEHERLQLVEEIDAARERADFRARVTAALAGLRDYDAALAGVARQMVPFFADWCTVDLLDDAGQLHRGAAAHRDPDDEARLTELRRRYEAHPRSLPTASVAATNTPLLSTEIPLERLREAAVDDDYFRRVVELGPASSIVVPLRAPGRVIGAMSFVYARSGRRYSERDLGFAEDLAQSAAIAIENARLFRELEEANRMKDEFLATLSHELRTPLNAILGWSSMLASRPNDDPVVLKALAAIDRNARAQTKLINDLLDVSRIVSGKLRLVRARVDLLRAIDAAADSVKLSCASKRIALELPDVEGLPRVIGDPDRMQQIVWNLLSNAVKFTPEGGRIAVTTRSDGQAVEIAVADTGVGIAPEFLPHVFDRFRQADSSTTRVHSGLGLGLAIVRQLTELHGGSVSAESRGPGTGATFTLRFPAAPAAGEGDAQDRAPDQDERDQRLRGIQILVVDDDRDAREFVQACLQRSGARVHVAESAAAAAALLQESLDLIITDIAMPGEDGYALLRQARSSKPTLPAIACTAYAMPEDRTRMARAGFTLHLSKPVEARGLVDAVSEALRVRPEA